MWRTIAQAGSSDEKRLGDFGCCGWGYRGYDSIFYGAFAITESVTECIEAAAGNDACVRVRRFAPAGEDRCGYALDEFVALHSSHAVTATTSGSGLSGHSCGSRIKPGRVAADEPLLGVETGEDVQVISLP
jgi:hypothetical protein